MHPQLISSGYDDMRLFKALFERSHYIGEVGLDFSKEYIQTKETQIINISFIGLQARYHNWKKQ